jgi:hypothetical protein
MMENTSSYSSNAASDIAVRALTFVTEDENRLSRFLDITGWTPATLSSPNTQSAILVSVLEYLMSEEDILLTFAANSRIEPGDIAKAHSALRTGDTHPDDVAR